MSDSEYALSRRLEDHLVRWEGWRPKAYKCPAGHWTIGVGHRLTGEELRTGLVVAGGEALAWRKGLSGAGIEAVLRADAAGADAAARARIGSRELTRGQADALASFVFNLGASAFAGSTLAKRIDAGDLDAVPGEMRRWVYARDPKTGKKRRLQGLIDRREAEIELWKSEYGDGGEEERPAVLEAERTGGDMEFLKDSFGQSSSLRLVYVGWAAVVGIGWLISTIKTGQIQPLPEGTWEVMGVLTGGKAIQKFAEERK